MNNTAKSPTLTTQSGFSLIELMVVVGIIGLLAAVAVPQFSKFQAKARQSEVKTNLAALFTAEKGFNAEYSGYTSDLRLIGFAVEGQNLRYNVGFPAVGGCFTGTGVTEVPANNLISVAAVNTSGATWFAGAAPGGTTGPTAAACTMTTFTALGFGNPNSGAGGLQDEWAMTQTKALTNSQNGIN